MVKVLIFGTGGVGIIYAYNCSKGGADVTVICRSNYDAVKKHGLTIESQIWGTVSCRPQNVVRSVAEAGAAVKDEGGYDYLLVCSKAFPGTAELIKDAVSDKTAIVRSSSLNHTLQKIDETRRSLPRMAF